MNLRAWVLIPAAAFAAASAFAGPPLAEVWNIAPTGRAASSGSLHFRVVQNDGSDPLDITVPVIMGAKDQTIARSIKNGLGSQLRRDRFKVELGEGTNVLVSDSRGEPNFSIELVGSDIDELRVAVQSVTPSAAPTVPSQTEPAETPVNPPPVRDAAPPPVRDAAPAPGSATPLPGAGMGIPDNSTPRLPNTSPPAPPPAKPDPG